MGPKHLEQIEIHNTMICKQELLKWHTWKVDYSIILQTNADSSQQWHID